MIAASDDVGLPEALKLALQYGGVPFACALAVVWALVKGWLITGREARKDTKYWENADAVWRERFEELRREAEKRIKEERADKEMWMTTALKATTFAKKAADKIPAGGQQDAQ